MRPAGAVGGHADNQQRKVGEQGGVVGGHHAEMGFVGPFGFGVLAAMAVEGVAVVGVAVIPAGVELGALQRLGVGDTVGALFGFAR